MEWKDPLGCITTCTALHVVAAVMGGHHRQHMLMHTQWVRGTRPALLLHLLLLQLLLPPRPHGLHLRCWGGLCSASMLATRWTLPFQSSALGFDGFSLTMPLLEGEFSCSVRPSINCTVHILFVYTYSRPSAEETYVLHG